MTKTTKTMLRTAPLGLIASAILFAGCVAPAGAQKTTDLSYPPRPHIVPVGQTMSDAAREALASTARSAKAQVDRERDVYAVITGQTMSDAAREALASTARSAKAQVDRERDLYAVVSGQTMSDAAREALASAALSAKAQVDRERDTLAF